MLFIFWLIIYALAIGEMAEWSNAVDSKSIVLVRVPGVRISLSPPIKKPRLCVGLFYWSQNKDRIRTHGKREFDYQRKPDGCMAVGIADERLCDRALLKRCSISLSPPEVNGHKCPHRRVGFFVSDRKKGQERKFSFMRHITFFFTFKTNFAIVMPIRLLLCYH